MHISNSHRASIRDAFLPLLIAAVIDVALLRGGASAAVQKTFVIPASDGYGISDCLASGTSCGRAVADAWCDAHGLGQSVAFGLSDDITGSIGTPIAKITPGSLVISCSP